ncbi:MAG: cyclic nucleotide-binding domain-containing protein [Rubrivivax sp.]|nr:cyclic nucleotide-binding domain-containing protein [Rubrivivax sp.]
MTQTTPAGASRGGHAPPPPRWRRTLGAAATAASGAATHAPENAAYGLMALAPLGAAFGPPAMGLALLGAAVASATASIAGGGRLVGDAGAALALLTATLVAALLPLVPGPPAEAGWTVLALVAVGIVGAGLLIALYGLLGIGALVKFTPYPVRLGLSTGVGLLLVLSALPAMLGQRFGVPVDPAQPLQAGAVAVAAATVGATALATWRRTRVPPVLLGLLAGVALQSALALAWSGATLSATVGVPELPAAWFGGALPSAPWTNALAQPAVWGLLGGFAFTVSVIASLDTLLAASVIDGRLRRSRPAGRELVAQGLANVASAVAGGLPASPSLPASLGQATGSPERHIVLGYAAVLAAILLVVPGVLGVLPLAAVGGALAFLGARMVSPTLWHIPVDLARGVPRWRAASRRERGRWGHLAADWAVTAAVAGSAVFLGLAEAVLIGAALAVLLFVQSNIRDVVGAVWSGAERHSLKTRPTAIAEILQREGRRIARVEIEGALFFGTADALRDRLQRLAPTVDAAIVDLRRAGDVDVTAARILVETAEDWHATGKRLVYAEWAAHDPRRDLVETLGAAAAPGALHFEDDADRAAEQAEDALLERLGVDRHDVAPLALAETTIARGLDHNERALLTAGSATRTFTRGEVLFRAGDPADALYICLRGEIGLRLPGTTRRLASFAPGVTIGEMAVLSGAPRSAEAFAETDVTALALPVDAFERLRRDHPELAGKLLGNIALQLSDRVRMLTADLAAREAREGRTRDAASGA